MQSATINGSKVWWFSNNIFVLYQSSHFSGLHCPMTALWFSTQNSTPAHSISRWLILAFAFANYLSTVPSLARNWLASPRAHRGGSWFTTGFFFLLLLLLFLLSLLLRWLLLQTTSTTASHRPIWAGSILSPSLAPPTSSGCPVRLLSILGFSAWFQYQL